ncbi:hypothetical protein N0V82_007900 [Gnomoniopsis sp. IMI 355080]|nr:hypothetical protein N0V82_007900 [Gnomoniopsis sp. IMI 355080]
MSSNKRHSILPPLKDSGPKAPVRFSSSLIIAESAILTGTHIITLRTESLVHPRAKIESAAGPVDVGKRCIVQERTHVGAVPAGAALSTGEAGAENTTGVTLHDYVTIQACAVVEAGGTVVGEGSVIGVGAKVGRGAVIGEYCTISPRTIIPPGTKIPNYTVVFSQDNQRRDRRDVKDIRKRQQVRQLEILQKLIPSNPAKFG